MADVRRLGAELHEARASFSAALEAVDPEQVDDLAHPAPTVDEPQHQPVRRGHDRLGLAGADEGRHGLGRGDDGGRRSPASLLLGGARHDRVRSHNRPKHRNKAKPRKEARDRGNKGNRRSKVNKGSPVEAAGARGIGAAANGTITVSSNARRKATAGSRGKAKRAHRSTPTPTKVEQRRAE